MRSASFTAFTADTEQPTLTFGKHRGTPLSEIETSYLEWVKTADRITPELLAAITTELATRKPKAQDRWRAPQGESEHTLLIARLIVEAGAAEIATALGQYEVTQAKELLKHMIDMTALESDPGELPL